MSTGAKHGEQLTGSGLLGLPHLDLPVELEGVELLDRGAVRQHLDEGLYEEAEVDPRVVHMQPRQ